MVIGPDVGERTNHDSHIRDLLLKNRFLGFNEKEVENVNKGGQRINKHVELWAKNVFDDYKFFCGLIQQDQSQIFQKMNLL
jgi:hypothetical protein